MNETLCWLRLTELDRINSPELAERIAEAESVGIACEPRRYPGYPTWPLPHSRRRWWRGLESTLAARRSHQALSCAFPSRRILGRLLQQSHGITADGHRGPTPSAGSLQALELYLVHWQPAWLPRGVYHYDRRGHCLAQIVGGAEEQSWRDRVPSLCLLSGGAMLWLVVGDHRRVAFKYGERADRYLLLEAGHLMQNLCLLSTSLGLVTVPLGGCLERDVARELKLPSTDMVLYAGVCGLPA